MARYTLQNRYQDSGWENLAYGEFEHCGDAVCRASELSEDAVAYGMVRVVDKKTGKIVIEYPAGNK